MEPLMKSDIFFFIASIATVIITILTSVVLIYMIKASRNLHKITKVIKNTIKIGSEEFIEDLKEKLENNLIFRLFSIPLKQKKSSKKED